MYLSNLVKVENVVFKTVLLPPGADFLVCEFLFLLAEDDCRVSNDWVEQAKLLPDFRRQQVFADFGQNDHPTKSTCKYKKYIVILQILIIISIITFEPWFM